MSLVCFHKKKLLKSTKKNDGIAYHHHLTGHTIDFKNTTILAEEKAYWPRLIKEGIEIKASKHASRLRDRYPIWDIRDRNL